MTEIKESGRFTANAVHGRQTDVIYAVPYNNERDLWRRRPVMSSPRHILFSTLALRWSPPHESILARLQFFDWGALVCVVIVEAIK
jgi:hypothetical protein